MAEGKKDPQDPTPDDTRVNEKLAAQDKAAGGSPVVLARDVNSLNPEPGDDVGEKQVQERIDKENEHGLRGIKVDSTPNENYTVAGNDLPTPETDDSLRQQVRDERVIDGPLPG